MADFYHPMPSSALKDYIISICLQVVILLTSISEGILLHKNARTHCFMVTRHPLDIGQILIISIKYRKGFKVELIRPLPVAQISNNTYLKLLMLGLSNANL
jgi:hypothetical protein